MRAANQHTSVDATLAVASATRVSGDVSHISPRTVKTAGQNASADIMVAVMGGTGTGKSAFIKLLADNEDIHVGHKPESETFSVQTAHYIDERTGRTVILVDTPGFDDSRDGVTDTDILEKIVRFLEPEEGEPRRLNGVIFTHRISDPRVGGNSRKNLRIFRSLCGDANLKNVRVVTTNWGRVGKEEGDEREKDLRNGAFKELVDAGASMRRHSNTVESARQIMSEFIPLEAVTMQIQGELREGKTLGDTSAGIILTAEMREIRKRHEKDLADLRIEMEDAAKANDLALSAELAEERKALELKMARAEDDKERLARTLEQAHADLAAEQQQLHELRQRTESRTAELQRAQAQMEEEKRRLAKQIREAEERRQAMERQQQEEGNRSNLLVTQQTAHHEGMHRKAESQSASRKSSQTTTEQERSHPKHQTRVDEKMRPVKVEREEQDTKRKDDPQLTAEHEERLRQARDNELALKKQADENHQKQVALEAQIAQVEHTNQQLERRANQGLFGWIRDKASSMASNFRWY